MAENSGADAIPTDKAAFLRQLRGFIGKPIGPKHAWDEVNQAMIRHWCDAMGDTNPVYTDPKFATQSSHGAIVAPPTMLQAWTMRGLTGREAPGSAPGEAYKVLEVLEAAGFPAVVAVNSEQEYFRYLKLGDRVYYQSQIEDVSEEKTTALGIGHFVTELLIYFDQDNNKVAEMRFRLFKYKAHQRPAAATPQTITKPAAPKRPQPAINHDNKFFWDGLKQHKLLIQRCMSCRKLRHPPAPMCPQCQSLAWDTVESSGRGVVYSYVVMHHPPVPPFEYPNPVGLIELEEGTRIVGQLIGIKAKDVKVGMPVQVEFVDEDPHTFALFRPVDG